MNKVQHDYRGHLWCGIGAISAALNIPTSEAREILMVNELRKHIKPVSYDEMNSALVSQGAITEREYFPRNWEECPRVTDWYDATRMKYGGKLVSDWAYVICILGHWIVIQGDHWVCSMNHTPRPMPECPYLNSRVKHVISFNKSDFKLLQARRMIQMQIES